MRESAEMYLETILVLQKSKDDGVHAVDVSRAMGFSKPSVSIALKRLKNQGYIDIDGFDHIILLPEGEKVAREIYARDQQGDLRGLQAPQREDQKALPWVRALQINRIIE